MGGDRAVAGSAATLRFDAACTELRGLGPALAERLAASVGVRTVGELLGLFPRRSRHLVELIEPADEHLGELVRIPLTAVGASRRFLPGRRSLVQARWRTAGGAEVESPFFNQPWLQKSWAPGDQRQLEGRLDRRGRRYVLTEARVLPRQLDAQGGVLLSYPGIEGVGEGRLRSFVQQALERLDPDSVPAPPLPPGLDDDLGSAFTALRAMHQPADVDEHERARRHFALAEAVALFRRVERLRRRRAARPAPGVRVDADHEAAVRAALPFDWTGDQREAVAALRGLLSGELGPMGVLLQGDVGTGKTAVALDAALAVIRGGHQVAFLAPTTLLAEQHARTFDSWLAGGGIRSALLTAELPVAEQRLVREQLAAGELDLVVGTHALFTARTRFARLGLAIVDEQHRFGVEQRLQLFDKGADCHVLVTTATPIPRTLAWSLFGDLDTVVLRERPAGRPPPRAVHMPREAWPRVLRAIDERVARGEKVFVVCSKIGAEGERGGVVRMHDELSRRHRCVVVHGQLPAVERAARVAELASGSVDVCVGTTVLEVGIDVPAATLMVVAGADQFGLATLHQLRGRVGRGARPGLCILAGENSARVAAVCATRDGFELAEADLRLRGAGELLGDRQSGALDFRALDPLDDSDILQQAREAVRAEPELP